MGAHIAVRDVLDLQFPECLRADFPEELPVALESVERVLEAMAGATFDALAANSPALAEFDWANYLRCSVARMVHVLAALRRRGVTGRVLDYGSYFGNCSIMLHRAGFEVEAIDSYRIYGEALSRCSALLQREGIHVRDFADDGRDLNGLQANAYDVVLFLGVIEHIPHSPRQTLEAITRVLKPGGHLVLDTPSHSYLYNRQRLARGESVMAAINAQFNARGAFEGHHREYTPAEVVWMLKQIGHTDVLIEMFNYSEYGLGRLEGRDLVNHWYMVLDPSMREVIMTASRKPAPGLSAPVPENWTELLHEAETFWQSRVPPDASALQGDTLVDGERRIRQLQTTAAELQAEVNRRDEMLIEREQWTRSEIQRRDAMLAELDARYNDLLRKWESRFSARLARLVGRLLPGR